MGKGVVRRQELVDKTLLLQWFLNDFLLVVLSERSWKLIEVHCRTVLTRSPQSRQVVRRLNFESAFGAVDPTNTIWIVFGVIKQLSDKMPQMNGAWRVLGIGGWIWVDFCCISVHALEIGHSIQLLLIGIHLVVDHQISIVGHVQVWQILSAILVAQATLVKAHETWVHWVFVDHGWTDRHVRVAGRGQSARVCVVNIVASWVIAMERRSLIVKAIHWLLTDHWGLIDLRLHLMLIEAGIVVAVHVFTWHDRRVVVESGFEHLMASRRRTFRVSVSCVPIIWLVGQRNTGVWMERSRIVDFVLVCIMRLKCGFPQLKLSMESVTTFGDSLTKFVLRHVHQLLATNLQVEWSTNVELIASLVYPFFCLLNGPKIWI